MPKKILLADDSVTIQKVVELTFSEGDYQVFSVGNGTQALKKIHEVQPDIALLDVIMPEANGYEVCEKVKRNPETSWIPVLLLTGTFEPFDRKRAEAAGANGHLTKPFESQMLITKVEELITTSHHPVVEPDRLGRMEIVAGGITRVEGEDPGLTQARVTADPGPEEKELTRHTIVPDRFDDFDAPPPPTEMPGVRTVRFSADLIPAPGTFSQDTASPPYAPSVETSAEPWDELASGLAAPPASRPPEELVAPLPSQEEARPAPAPEKTFLPPPPAPSIAPEPSTAEVGQGGISPAEMDRLVSRVVEHLSDRVLREIAWEVIPEMAESLIKQRIRELEEKIAREG